MKPPDHPVRPPFEKATDALSAWREQQKALLKEQERDHYNRIIGDRKKEQEEKARELDNTKQQRIQEEKRRQLIAQRNLVLEMFRSRAAKERQAEEAAKRIVHTRDLSTIQTIAHQTLQAGDQFLKDREQERKKEKLKEAFRRAAAQKAHRRDKYRGGRER